MKTKTKTKTRTRKSNRNRIMTREEILKLLDKVEYIDLADYLNGNA